MSLINRRRTGQPLRLFQSHSALIRHIMDEEIYFPKQVAKDDGYVNVFLEKVFY